MVVARMLSVREERKEQTRTASVRARIRKANTSSFMEETGFVTSNYIGINGIVSIYTAFEIYRAKGFPR